MTETSPNRLPWRTAALAGAAGLLVALPAPTSAAATASDGQPIRLTALASAHAQADSYYDGKSPMATGCYKDARTVASKRVGPRGSRTRILLRYSPHCRTVWARIIRATPRDQDRAGGSALIYREQDGAAKRCYSKTGHTGCRTRMLYDGGFTSHATGTNDPGNWKNPISKARTRSF